MPLDTLDAGALFWKLRGARQETEALEEKERALTKALEDVRAELARKRTYINELAYMIAPISRIPSEVLSTILMIAADDDGALPISALSVSQFWHKTAMETAGLWSRITIGPYVDRAAVFLARSRGHSLTLTIVCDNVGVWGRCRPLCAAIYLEFHRILSLTISTSDATILDSLLDALPPAAPSLMSFIIDDRTKLADERTVRLFPSGAPMLTNLGYHGDLFKMSNFVPLFPRITSFSWDSVHIYELDKFNIPKLMPAVTHLQSFGSYAEIQQTVPRTVAVYVGGPLAGPEFLFKVATAAPLDALELYSTPSHNMDDMFSLLLILSSAHVAGIRSLTLGSCSTRPWEDSAHEYMRTLGALETLVLEDYAESSGVGALLDSLAEWDEDASAVILPRLRRLVVRSRPAGREPVRGDVLLALVRLRAMAGGPLAELVLLASHCEAIGPAVVAELRESVFVEIEG